MGGSFSPARMMQLNEKMMKAREKKVQEFCRKVEGLEKEYGIEIDSADGMSGVTLYLEDENGNVFPFEWDNGEEE